MTNVTDSSNLDNLQVGVVVTVSTDNKDTSDKSKKGAAALLLKLSDALTTIEGTSKHKDTHNHTHTVDTTEDESDDSVNEDQGTDKGQGYGDSNPDSNDSSDAQDSSAETSEVVPKFKNNSDCLMEVLEAGITMTGSMGKLMDATAASGVATSEAASAVAKFETSAITEYQKYGNADGGMHIDQVGKDGYRKVGFRIQDGRIQMLQNPGYGTKWQDIGPANKDSSGNYEEPKLPSEYTFNTGNHNSWKSTDFQNKLKDGDTPSVIMCGPASSWIGNGSDGKSGGIANASSTDRPLMMAQLQIMTATQNQVNSDMSNVAQIAGTSMQGETQTETLVQSIATSSIQASQGINQQISSLSSV